jgi:hypothetical protein
VLVRIVDEWTITFDQDGAYIEFASVSCVGGETAEVSVFLNEDLKDRVHVNVPHSWWKNAGQQIIPSNPAPGDVMKITTDRPIDLRLDIVYP